MIGGSATFDVSVVADDPSFQWQLAADRFARHETDSSLTVTDLTAALRGPYRVIITDSSLNSITSADAFINFAPTILTNPASQTVTLGSNATFSVVAAGDNTNLVFRWLFGTNVVKIETNFPNPLTNSSSLTVSNVGTTNIGTYTVLVTNKYGSVTSPAFTLAVGIAPTIQSAPANQTNNVGSTVTFSVTASGNPSPGYQWRFNGTDLPGQNGPAFTLNNIQPRQPGHLHCRCHQHGRHQYGLCDAHGCYPVGALNPIGPIQPNRGYRRNGFIQCRGFRHSSFHLPMAF